MTRDKMIQIHKLINNVWLSDIYMTVSIAMFEWKINELKLAQHTGRAKKPKVQVRVVFDVWLIQLEFPFNGWLIDWRQHCGALLRFRVDTVCVCI